MPFNSPVPVSEVIDNNPNLMTKEVDVVFPDNRIEKVPVYKLGDDEEDEIAVIVEF